MEKGREKWGTGKGEGKGYNRAGKKVREELGRRGWQGLKGGNKGDSQGLKRGKYERTRTHDQPHSRPAR